ncbi:hypothetical protein GCM10009864_56250 [Streptomyces lunalinharesii]|uniref:Uncharacterized protein n=1 Tax=Streptomyces lunalinharesii TaxID=333384 RepID=A0ABN3SKZ6_9ACTN
MPAKIESLAWEYFTYAPAGSRCTACRKEIKTVELARRGNLERPSGQRVVIYRHADKCPE